MTNTTQDSLIIKVPDIEPKLLQDTTYNLINGVQVTDSEGVSHINKLQIFITINQIEQEVLTPFDTPELPLGTYVVRYVAISDSQSVTELSIELHSIAHVEPIIVGVSSLVMAKGDTKDVYEGVSATDFLDNLIPVTAHINGVEVTTDYLSGIDVGTYSIVYSATDYLGSIITSAVDIDIKAPYVLQSLRPEAKEITLYQRMFFESAKFLGIHSTFYQVDSMTATRIDPDVGYTYKDPVTVPIIFNAEPSAKMLEKYGWNSQNDDEVPYVADIPVFYKNSLGEEVPLDINEGAKIEISYSDAFYGDKAFTVENIVMQLDKRFYTINLAPRRQDKEAERESTSRNNKYLNDY